MKYGFLKGYNKKQRLISTVKEWKKTLGPCWMKPFIKISQKHLYKDHDSSLANLSTCGLDYRSLNFLSSYLKMEKSSNKTKKNKIKTKEGNKNPQNILTQKSKNHSWIDPIALLEKIFCGILQESIFIYIHVFNMLVKTSTNYVVDSTL